jgi:hypothetical protein
MKTVFRSIAALGCGLVLFASVVSAADPIPVETARRSAEYHAEQIFRRDFRIVGQRLMTWPWGEPAVYVFTLIGAGDPLTSPPQLEPEFRLGTHLVSIGREEEGYRLMARPDRYATIYTGATDDMPSMLKAHAGLPEHVLALATMTNPPPDPAWIYGGLFHVLLASESRLAITGARGVEIHTRQEYVLNELAREKSGTLPPGAAASEWAPFLAPGRGGTAAIAAPSLEIEGVEEGEHKLPVQEANIKTVWKGCSPAAFYNCLKYLESKGKIGTQGKGPAALMDWIAICYHTDPSDGGTKSGWIINGSTLMFMGLGYNSQVGQYRRIPSAPGTFLVKFAAEIEAGYPCNLGSTGKGIFTQHSTTGIGYWKKGRQAQLIIHDGWKTTPNVPVYVKYMGYPSAQIAYPAYLRSFHPGRKEDYPIAEPNYVSANPIRCDPTLDRWKFYYKLNSSNDVIVETYAYEALFYNVRNRKYKHVKPHRLFPFWNRPTNLWNYFKLLS